MRRLQIFLLFALLLAVLLVLNGHERGLIIGVSVYGAGTIAYILFKLLAASWYKPCRGPVPVGGAAAVVPFFNEDAETLRRSLQSLLCQSSRVDEIWVIDDGSANPACYLMARALLEGRPGAHVIRQEENRGKRHAQAYAFARSDADYFVTFDSDTVLDEDAIAEGLRPFSDPAVQAVTGNVRALNRNENILSRLIDLRYQNAFQNERAAYSVFSSVLCCSGVLSFYRAKLIRDNLTAYLSQTFLGVSVMAGDDRRLTNYALQRGRVIYQSTALAETVVPNRFAQFLRQQIRWNKSFFRETLYVLTCFGPMRAAWWLALAEMAIWLIFGLILVLTLALAPIAGGKILSVYYFGYISLMAYLRNLHLAEQWQSFLMAPLYGLIHILVLVPLRFYALATIRDSAWMTRQTRA